MDTEIKLESSTPAPQDIDAYEEVSPAAPKIRGFLIVVAIGLVASFMGNLGQLAVPAIAESQAYAKQGHGLIVKFIALHLWIPYFVVSDRVKRTFIR